MKIAVIGAGHVGGTLGKGWAKKGHEIIVGVRDAADPKLKELLAALGGKAHAASVKEAASNAEVVALTVPWGAVPDALKNAGDLRGKIILDCTNPLKPDLSGLVVSDNTSAGQQVAVGRRKGHGSDPVFVPG